MKESTSRRRVTRRVAVASVAMMSIAAPAVASVVIQNFIKGTVTAQPACFTKIIGSDHTAYSINLATVTKPYVNVVTTSTAASVAGAVLLNESVDVRGFAGDRTKYTDVIRYKNNCGYAVSVRLTAETDAAGTPATTAWSGMTVRTFLSKVVAPVPTTNLPQLETDTTNWDQQFLINSTGVVTATGTAQTVAAGAELQGAFVVDVDSAAAAASFNTFHYTASATI